MGRSHAGGVPGRGCGTNGNGSGSNPIAVLISALLGLLLVVFMLPGCGENSEGGTSDSMTTSAITEVSSTGDAVQAAVPAAELSDVEPGQVLEIVASDATGRTQRFLVDPDGQRIRVEDIDVPEGMGSVSIYERRGHATLLPQDNEVARLLNGDGTGYSEYVRLLPRPQGSVSYESRILQLTPTLDELLDPNHLEEELAELQDERWRQVVEAGFPVFGLPEDFRQLELQTILPLGDWSSVRIDYSLDPASPPSEVAIISRDLRHNPDFPVVGLEDAITQQLDAVDQVLRFVVDDVGVEVQVRTDKVDLSAVEIAKNLGRVN